MSYRHNFLVYLSEGMVNCKMFGKSQEILTCMISGNSAQSVAVKFIFINLLL